MNPIQSVLASTLLLAACGTGAAATGPQAAPPQGSDGPAVAPDLAAHRDQVMTSAFCSGCHPDIYAEHEQSTHGRAFTDDEARLATARFSSQDCIICHTPRPIFETGMGQNPIRRFHNLEEGNTCMTCHWKPGYEYGRFQGGAECKTAFHPDVGKVEACASCHRNHGTPYQWEKAPTGKQSGRTCIDCHMAKVERPVAAGSPVRTVRSHVFPGSRNEAHLRRAYSYTARIDGNEAVVSIKNKGTGHNFPTELKQRSVESVVVVRDLEGKEVGRSRMVFRDPYKRPYGLDLPVNTQIPAGQAREHRVPLKVAAGTVETELYFKLYFPIEDSHPDLSRRLESSRLLFQEVTPSDKEIVSEPEVKVVVPEGIDVHAASPGNLVDYVRPPIAKVAVDIPSGDSAADVQKLIELFQFPVPEANGRARKKLAAIGAPAIPALITALGSWDNKTWNQAMAVLQEIGPASGPALLEATRSEELYVRLHSREVLGRMGLTEIRSKEGSMVPVAPDLLRGLSLPHALDRSNSASVCGELRLKEAIPALRTLLDDPDWDVVRAAALALAGLGDKEAVPAMSRRMRTASFPETRRDLAQCLARLGSFEGVPELLRGLGHRDELIRESFAEALVAATGLHMGFDPRAPEPDRKDAMAALWAAWVKGEVKPAPAPQPDRKTRMKIGKLAYDLGGSDLAASTPEMDAEMMAQLGELGEVAIPALADGLKYPPGFVDKRIKLCQVLGEIQNPRGAPALLSALRDPVLATATAACKALESSGDPWCLPALRVFEQRVAALAEQGRVPQSVGTADRVLAQAARTRLKLGDETARTVLIAILLSEDRAARELAIDGLRLRYGVQHGYDPADPIEDRRKAVEKWLRQ